MWLRNVLPASLPATAKGALIFSVAFAAGSQMWTASAADLQRWLAHLAPDDAVRTRLARLLSSMTFRQSISEAFR